MASKVFKYLAERVRNIFLIVSFVARNNVVTFFPLYLKYIGLSVCEMGVIQGIPICITLIFINIWTRLLDELHGRCLRRALICMCTFIAMGTCVCLFYVPPQSHVQNITHCKIDSTDKHVFQLSSQTSEGFSNDQAVISGTMNGHEDNLRNHSSTSKLQNTEAKYKGRTDKGQVLQDYLPRTSTVLDDSVTNVKEITEHATVVNKSSSVPRVFGEQLQTDNIFQNRSNLFHSLMHSRLKSKENNRISKLETAVPSAVNQTQLRAGLPLLGNSQKLKLEYGTVSKIYPRKESKSYITPKYSVNNHNSSSAVNIPSNEANDTYVIDELGRLSHDVIQQYEDTGYMEAVNSNYNDDDNLLLKKHWDSNTARQDIDNKFHMPEYSTDVKGNVMPTKIDNPQVKRFRSKQINEADWQKLSKIFLQKKLKTLQSDKSISPEVSAVPNALNATSDHLQSNAEDRGERGLKYTTETRHKKTADKTDSERETSRSGYCPNCKYVNDKVIKQEPNTAYRTKNHTLIDLKNVTSKYHKSGYNLKRSTQVLSSLSGTLISGSTNKDKHDENRKTENIRILKTVSSVGDSEVRISSFFRHCFKTVQGSWSKTFVTVLILYTFFSLFSSLIRKCAESIETQTFLEKLRDNERSSVWCSLIWGVLGCPAVAAVVILSPCPYQIAFHLPFSAVLLFIALVLALFTLPNFGKPMVRLFRMRKPSKPPYKAENEGGQTSLLQRILLEMTALISGFSTASSAEFILWHVEGLPGFPYNYEFLYCGYHIVGTLTEVTVTRWLCTRPSIENGEDLTESEDDDVIHYSYKLWMNWEKVQLKLPEKSGATVAIGLFFLAMQLFSIPLLESAWPVLLLGPLKGCSNGLLGTSHPSLAWSLGYSAGCVLGGFLQDTWGVNAFFWTAAVMALFWSAVSGLCCSSTSCACHWPSWSYSHLIEQPDADVDEELQVEEEGDWLERVLQQEEYQQSKAIKAQKCIQ